MDRVDLFRMCGMVRFPQLRMMNSHENEASKIGSSEEHELGGNDESCLPRNTQHKFARIDKPVTRSCEWFPFG